MLYDDQHPTFRVLRSPCLPPVGRGAEGEAHASAVWGPTCDSADCVYKACELPELRVGDCLVFSNAGAYTVAGARARAGLASPLRWLGPRAPAWRPSLRAASGGGKGRRARQARRPRP